MEAPCSLQCSALHTTDYCTVGQNCKVIERNQVINTYDRINGTPNKLICLSFFHLLSLCLATHIDDQPTHNLATFVRLANLLTSNRPPVWTSVESAAARGAVHRWSSTYRVWRRVRSYCVTRPPPARCGAAPGPVRSWRRGQDDRRGSSHDRHRPNTSHTKRPLLKLKTISPRLSSL